MKWLTGLARNIRAFFTPEKAAAPKPDPIPANLSAQIARKPGLECPACGEHIVITIDMLLTQRVVYCTFCFLELGIDREKSKESLSALSKLHQDFARANTMAEAAKQ
ncbi:MAG: hypothetical protein INR69_10330 [Mucilaginibacter polytrichastri]|nr:hypothetical protein [Mucilaginibacter polytrichastri]